MVNFDKVLSDSEIASRVKSIYIESNGLDQETLSDHWSIDYGQFLELLFEKDPPTDSTQCNAQ